MVRQILRIGAAGGGQRGGDPPVQAGHGRGRQRVRDGVANAVVVRLQRSAVGPQAQEVPRAQDPLVAAVVGAVKIRRLARHAPAQRLAGQRHHLQQASRARR